MMEITIITTGGSIDKDYPKPTKGYAFEIGPPAIERVLEDINPNFSYTIIPLLQKDSQDITAQDREEILKACNNTSSDLILITHGTDTIIDTARKLSELKDKVIVLTGAQRPARFSDSDAAFNLGCAIGALSTLGNGVYIAMQGRAYPWDKCRRDEATGRFIEI